MFKNLFGLSNSSTIGLKKLREKYLLRTSSEGEMGGGEGGHEAKALHDRVGTGVGNKN